MTDAQIDAYTAKAEADIERLLSITCVPRRAMLVVKAADALHLAVSDAIASKALWMDTDDLHNLIDNLDYTCDEYHKARRG